MRLSPGAAVASSFVPRRPRPLPHGRGSEKDRSAEYGRGSDNDISARFSRVNTPGRDPHAAMSVDPLHSPAGNYAVALALGFLPFLLSLVESLFDSDFFSVLLSALPSGDLPLAVSDSAFCAFL